MAEYIELIDKYRVCRSVDSDLPTSYTWVDNTGEIVRCGECKYNDHGHCDEVMDGHGVDDDWFCKAGERKVQE